MRPHCLAITLTAALTAMGATYHLDSTHGNDANDGLTPATAWQTLDKLKKEHGRFKPDDSILFKRGGLWRGTVKLASGKPQLPITYSNYGDGPLPVIQGSISVSKLEDWQEVRPGLWRTIPPELSSGKELPADDLSAASWLTHAENSAKVQMQNITDNGRTTFKLNVSNGGTAPNHIQCWGPYLPDFSHLLILRMRGRSNRPLTFSSVAGMLPAPPWQCSAISTKPLSLTPEWQDFELRLQRLGSSIFKLPMRLHINAGQICKDGDEIELQITGAATAQFKGGLTLPADIGNIIIDHGSVPCPRKRWSMEQLKDDKDYFYSRQDQCVYMKSDANPASGHSSVELAQCNHIISHGNAHDVIVDGLAVRYGAAHGFGGGSCARIVIRNCDVYYIGGGHQFTRADGTPVRYGNGIEFWGDANDCLVENNRLWEIYDAALTNQGRNSTETNITYRNNVIWNAEFSFEYWNAKLTDNIRFINNTCIDAGKGWAHSHRPDPNGAHLMFYGNTAKTTRFVVRNNIFVSATDQGLRMDVDWSDAIDLDHNLWYLADNVSVYRIKPKADPTRFHHTTMADLKEKRSPLPLDRHSVFNAPTFKNPAERDYRLAPDSPGMHAADDGGAVGMRN